MSRKIYVVGNSFEYANWMQGKLTKTMEEADLVVFTGGEDVSPYLYGEPAHPRTGANKSRDLREMAEFERALKLNKPMIGICRGSQFLCVMAGGKLVQHQQNKYGNHPITMKDGSIQNITSTHHQAMYPFNLPKDEYDILGWGENLSDFHEDGNKKELSKSTEDFKECEIVFFPAINALGIQGHPEYGDQDEDTKAYLQQMLTDFLENKLVNQNQLQIS